MKTIYLVRHGESESNVGGVILGGAKTSLTDRGREQAGFVAERCSRLPIDVIIASPYLRAKLTAEIIAARIGVSIESSDFFAEWNMGSHREGRKADDPGLIQEIKALVEQYPEENSRTRDEENFNDLNQRSTAALEYLTARPEDHILLVGHGMFSTILLGKVIMGRDFTGRDCEHMVKAFSIKNTGISVLTYDSVSETRWSEWKVITWNDHAHLG